MDGSCDVTKKPIGWRASLKSWYFWKPIVGFVAGTLAGAIYFVYLGSASGSSPVTHDIISNGLFGGMIGYFFVRRPCRACC